MLNGGVPGHVLDGPAFEIPCCDSKMVECHAGHEFYDGCSDRMPVNSLMVVVLIPLVETVYRTETLSPNIYLKVE